MKDEKHAVLISVYKDMEYLELLVKKLSPDFDVYIHVDKSSREIKKEQIQYLEKQYHCVCLSNYVCCWAGFNVLLAYIDMLRIAVQKEYKYYHIITGEDIPVKSAREIYNYFKDNDRIYISLHEAITDNLKDRYKYWYPFVNKDPRARPWQQLNAVSLTLQKFFRVNRKRIGCEEKVYKGYVYGSLPHDAVRYVLDYVDKNPLFMRDLSMCYIMEELFFQTILGNSPYRNRIAKNCLRYSVWEYKYDSIPGYLDEEDIRAIDAGDYIFARKVNKKFSEQLIQEMDRRYYEQNIQ